MGSIKGLSRQRQGRVRAGIRKRSKGRIRLSVFRSGRHMYAQVIDDSKGETLVAASSIDKDLRTKLIKSAGVETAGEVGKLVAIRAMEAGIGKVVFDRGAYQYHGRVKALAEAARGAGLSF